MAEGIGWQASGKNGAVAGGGKEAVGAGLEILKAGGNAIDASVATILALSVTDFHQYFCFGGEAPILVYDAKEGVVEVLCGQGRSAGPVNPAAAGESYRLWHDAG